MGGITEILAGVGRRLKPIWNNSTECGGFREQHLLIAQLMPQVVHPLPINVVRALKPLGTLVLVRELVVDDISLLTWTCWIYLRYRSRLIAAAERNIADGDVVIGFPLYRVGK